MDENEKHMARQTVIAKMTEMAVQHADMVYAVDGNPVLENDSEKLFALLTDTAFAYAASLELETEDPGPGHPLFVKIGMPVLEAMFTGLEENLTEEGMKYDDPLCVPVNGWTFWRMGDDGASGPEAKEERK